MPEFLALARRLLSPLLLILSACGISDTSYSNRILADGHDVLVSKAHARDGAARFQCVASDSGQCHYTLFAAACDGKPDCTHAPLQRFTVARGQTRHIAGLDDFRVCVGIDATVMGADCKPAKAEAH